MIGLQSASEPLKRTASLVFSPGSRAETNALRGVVAAYVEATPNELDSYGRNANMIGRMTLDAIDAVVDQDPKQGGTMPCISFPNRQSVLIQDAFAAVSPDNADAMTQALATQIAGFELRDVRAA